MPDRAACPPSRRPPSHPAPQPVLFSLPKRIRRQSGRHARVDDIPFTLPVNSEHSPALMAAFPLNANKAADLLPGNELHPLHLWGNMGLLLVSVINYRKTDIGQYIEYSIGIACTHGRRPAPYGLPLLFRKSYGVGQYVFDLPVSTEVSVKGGKGIWGMPKHQARLDFLVEEDTVSSQYDLDGELAMRVDIDRPESAWMPIRMSTVNYCQFRGMMMKSVIHFRGTAGFFLFDDDSAELTIGDHPRLAPLKTLDIRPNSLFTAFFPSTNGVLDDHIESWFISSETPIARQFEGLESVVDLGQSEKWPPPPKRDRQPDPEMA